MCIFEVKQLFSVDILESKSIKATVYFGISSISLRLKHCEVL